ncbi:GDSL-type esterase/lipase family protein [Mucilaginibacter polytrichastri]|uniref:SGNH hydrolase-type esterase domain-containing protein n=1 Tax=Mucilaginibacter polytrichastri TaxID=1302689 RepID=A0A1Q5ZTJ7_9SPHI|nr:GDSL-type esterase/lipase family protein [Mucilaginibacter polytrichastri]OKS85086.1 hypothetical protein RG47T_0525 [Mucilaginibacter polytrichastri]SFS44727.1 Lysophospholipase L1 [Mucilaginibacter polytrichastri]
MLNKKLTVTYCIIALVCCSFIIKPGNIDIVFIGDSITHGAGLKAAETQAPPVIAVNYLNQLGIGTVQCNNQGVSGFTTVDFLPATKKAYPKVIAAADAFYADKSAQLIFSVMLGTNDSAIKGPNGAPVAAAYYHTNIKLIADSLLARYPECKIVLHRPIWYSDSTHNGSTYLVEGRERLNSYFPEIKLLVKEYKSSNPGHVFLGDNDGYNYFKKNYLTDLGAENGRSGIFYLHPNEKGAAALGVLWGKAIARILK